MSEPNGNDYNWREIYDILTDMKVDMGIIKTQMTQLSEVKKTAEGADGKAAEALALAKENAKDIDGIKKTTTWAIGLIVPSILTIVGILATVVF
jgi:hypothetical protein